MRWLVVVIVAAHCLQIALTAKILALCAVLSHSHSLWCYKYMAALVERGHQVTVFGVDKPKIEIQNLKTYIVEGAYDAPKGEEIMEFMSDFDQSSRTATMYLLQFWQEKSSDPVMHSQTLKDLISDYRDFEKPFDLIIHDNANLDALLGLVPLFGNPPLLLATTFGAPQWMTSRAGNIFNPAYVPNMLSDFDQHMTFWQRCENTFYFLFVEWFIRTKFEPYQERLKRERFGDNLPHVRDLVKRANVVIVNHHPALNDPCPLLPGVVGIAGLHISEPQPLPKDIQEFMDGAENGVILLSFGSNVDSNWFAPDFEAEILKALENLPQRVLWKWDKTPHKVPPNVKISKWLPQGDVLVHPNLRLFITHCGLLSTQEAIFRKVPILALPIFLDQFDTAAKLAKRNLTITLDVSKLTAEVLRRGINEILSNPMYKSNIAQLGSLMQDMPFTAKQQAVYWTEYAIRHNGATHLHSAAADMPWYQLLLLDVIGLCLTVTFIALWCIKIVLSFVFMKFLSRTKLKSD